MDAFDVEHHGNVDAAVVAYPHGASAPAVAELHDRGVKVVDLSADFRLRDRRSNGADIDTTGNLDGVEFTGYVHDIRPVVDEVLGDERD